MKNQESYKEQDSCCKALEVSKFNDCGIEEKVVRLHSVIIDLRRSLQWGYDRECRMATQIHQLMNHQHSSSGACMITIEDSNRGNSQITGGISPSIDLLA
jgi:hypothetical protein